MLQAHATGMAAAEGRKRPDFVLKLYRMLKECPELITWENGLIVMPSPSRLERILPNYFRHGKFTSFQRQLNNFCLLYTSPSPRDGLLSRMPSSA